MGVRQRSGEILICSKSACAFPMISNAVWVVASFRSLSASSRRNRAISACSAEGRPTFAPGSLPSNRPASRNRRHSQTNEEYRPSRRRYAPPCPDSHAASYSARCLSFWAGVNDRRRDGPSARGELISPSSTTTGAVERTELDMDESILDLALRQADLL